MSAPVLRDPLVVRLQDGSCWVRRAQTEQGRGLYALDGTVKGCPEAVMVTLAELREYGLAVMSDVLPEGPAPERGPLWSLLDWSFWGAGMGDVFREPLADSMLAAISPETVAQAEELMAEFIRRREISKTGVTVYQEQRDELEQLRERLAEYERPVDEDPIAFSLTEAAPLTVYRASHDSIVMGLYSTREAAREHCAALIRREFGDRGWLTWVPDDASGDDATEELAFSDGPDDESPDLTGYVVTPLEVASKYDEEGDE